MDGIINIDKPAGMTSYKVVSVVKRLSGEKRVGHTGTLDPAATGVLPVCLGQGTRVIEYLMGDDKAYRAEIALGVSTDTYDGEGKVTERLDASGVTRDQVEAALTGFRGEIEQTPPVYSALKYHGKPLYELARAGVAVAPKSRTVTIHKLELVDWSSPLVTIEVACSKGTYIRALANDLGQALGCGAYLKSLRRLRCGQFDIKDSVPLAKLEEAFRLGCWEQFMYPIDCVLQGIEAVVVNDEERRDIKNGKPLTIKNLNGELRPDGTEKPSLKNCCRAYAVDGAFIGVLRYVPESGYWQPDKVFIS